MPTIEEDPPLSRDGFLQRPADFVVDDFIWNTKFIRNTSESDFTERIGKFFASPELVKKSRSNFREYLICKTIELPKKTPALNLNLEKAILKRQSSRKFSAKPIKLASLAALLRASAGLKQNQKWVTDVGERWPCRAAGSAGALYPIEIYLLVQAGMAGLDHGIYHFNVRDFTLELIEGLDRPTACRLVPEFELNPKIKAGILVTGNFGRSMVKYGRRGARFVFIEAGHVQAHLHLAATALGIGLYHYGGGFDLEIEAKLNLDGLDDALLGITLIG